MLKLNLKIAIRNLLKHKAYTLTNVLGLALGLAGFIFILLYVNHEKSYDHWHPALKDVYQVQELDRWELKAGRQLWVDETDLRFSLLLKESMPQVENVTRITELKARSVIIGNDNPFLQEGIINADPYFFSVFPMRFIYGDPSNALLKPGSLVIKQQFALKHFGNVNPIGKTIQINEQNWTRPELFTITGVVAEPTTPSTVNFEIIQSSWRQTRVHENFISFAQTYVKVKPGQQLTLLNKTAQALYSPLMTKLFKQWKLNMAEFKHNGLELSVRFMPLHEVHQQPLNGNSSWLDLVKPVILLSTLLLLISMINFVNMFTAQAIPRAKEVGIRKVIGSSRKSLIKQFLLETALQVVIALLLSLILLEGFLPYLNGIFNLSLSFAVGMGNWLILAELALLLLFITLLVGIYPAFFLSAYRPQLVLKGNLGHSHKGKVLRNVLAGLQFVIAVGFLTGIMIISKQLSFMEAKDPGFEARAVITINDRFQQRIARQLEKIDGVKYVGSNGGMISRNLNLTGRYRYKQQTREIVTVSIYLDGLNALLPKLVSGRLFEKHNIQDSISTVILNETLANQFGGNMVGKFIYVNDSVPVQVVGVIKDMQITGLEKLIEPTVYTAAFNNATGYPNIGLNYVIGFDLQKRQAILRSIEKLWKREFPTFPLHYSFAEDDLAKLLVPHQRFKEMVKIFSVLSVILSLIGLFALAAFLIQQRFKEIAIRKIIGAGNGAIFLLINKDYIWLMLLANLASWPIIYIAVNHWLNGFAYRIDVPIWPFMITFVLSIALTVITVSFRIKHAIQAKPVDALKYE